LAAAIDCPALALGQALLTVACLVCLTWARFPVFWESLERAWYLVQARVVVLALECASNDPSEAVELLPSTQDDQVAPP
jgi:hypothetical protein